MRYEKMVCLTIWNDGELTVEDIEPNSATQILYCFDGENNRDGYCYHCKADNIEYYKKRLAKRIISDLKDAQKEINRKLASAEKLLEEYL